MKTILRNIFHIFIGIAIILILWIGSARIYVLMFGVNDMAILVAALGMFIGVGLAFEYWKKVFKWYKNDA